MRAAFAYGTVTAGRAASFDMGQATTAQVRTTASYRIQVEASWQGTNISIPVCGGAAYLCKGDSCLGLCGVPVMRPDRACCAVVLLTTFWDLA